jgi:hypothetical protein
VITRDDHIGEGVLWESLYMQDIPERYLFFEVNVVLERNRLPFILAGSFSVPRLYHQTPETILNASILANC